MDKEGGIDTRSPISPSEFAYYFKNRVFGDSKGDDKGKGKESPEYLSTYLSFHKKDVISSYKYPDYTEYEIKVQDGRTIHFCLEDGIESESVQDTGAHTPPRQPRFGRLLLNTAPVQECITNEMETELTPRASSTPLPELVPLPPTPTYENNNTYENTEEESTPRAPTSPLPTSSFMLKLSKG